MIKRIKPKELLAESLMELAKKHLIQSITVTDITENCQVSRQMFYYHFSSKYDLISWIYRDKADKIVEEYIEKEPWGKVAGRIIEFIKDDYIYFKKAFDDDTHLSFYNIIYNYTVECHTKHILKRTNKDILPAEVLFAIRFNAYGGVNVTRDWLENGMKETPSELGELIYSAMPSSISPYFEAASRV
ncbi:HTH-type dhaKLM operon transcriptional activator DhaS [compost metagenome]